MKIIINNVQFDYNTGCKLLKLKHTECPYESLEDIWEDIVPMTFKDIATQITNLEQRRIAILCLGLDRLVSEVKPELVDKQSIKKQTTWVNPNGELITKNFTDTYELYRVIGKDLNEGLSWQVADDVFYVKCKDTSTDRDYLIWVDIREVYRTNVKEGQSTWYDKDKSKVNAIQAIAWTIQTDVPTENIEKIVRQGDCVLIKRKEKTKSVSVRHLTEEEYRTLLVAES